METIKERAKKRLVQERRTRSKEKKLKGGRERERKEGKGGL